MTQRRNTSLAVLVVAIVVVLWRTLFPSGPGTSGGDATTSGECGDKFAYGRITFTVQDPTTFLCRSQYAVLHDDARKVPLYSAEKLVGEDVDADVSRTEDFRPDEALPASERAELNDYRGSGFDRGHMTPAADSDTPKEMSESFLLSNMVPQNGPMNQGIWAGLEGATRACAQQVGEIYVITGPVFEGNVRTIGDGVAVPSALYKIVLDAKSGDSRAFLMPNRSLRRSSDYAQYETTIDDVERRTNLDFFPQGSVDEARRGTLCPQAYGS
ncbi:DNA/RNA non-specific endonuclease [Deinococcus pimensis]|uniref:DNA/RNA non-specific endonuclease n=1 Tax=Deinococcus pimensis TaxID=309888 RepID=UPI000693981D|nr:DNA/RNA non-specific endonuclease [Deinococcus pimensis]